MITELIIEVLSSLMSGLTGVSDTFIELFFRKKQILKEDKKTQETLSKKLEKLTDNLHETSVLMAEIETEFQQQKELAEKWSKEAETSQIIASMSEKEVEAVTKILAACLKKMKRNQVENRGGGIFSFAFLALLVVI